MLKLLTSKNLNLDFQIIAPFENENEMLDLGNYVTKGYPYTNGLRAHIPDPSF